uniref:Uncharacterized protein n=1 Tax=Opuntia streptacantha TaxID=393608 RepID=A0A7C9DIV4_OPUST
MVMVGRAADEEKRSEQGLFWEASAVGVGPMASGRRRCLKVGGVFYGEKSVTCRPPVARADREAEKREKQGSAWAKQGSPNKKEKEKRKKKLRWNWRWSSSW